MQNDLNSKFEFSSIHNTGNACKRKEEDHHVKSPEIRHAKKPRLVFTDIQRRTLHAIFKETKRPSKEMQATIAQQLVLEVSTVGNFFMNARRRSLDKWQDDETHSSGLCSPSPGPSSSGNNDNDLDNSLPPQSTSAQGGGGCTNGSGIMGGGGGVGGGGTGNHHHHPASMAGEIHLQQLQPITVNATDNTGAHTGSIGVVSNQANEQVSMFLGLQGGHLHGGHLQLDPKLATSMPLGLSLLGAALDTLDNSAVVMAGGGGGVSGFVESRGHHHLHHTGGHLSGQQQTSHHLVTSSASTGNTGGAIVSAAATVNLA